MDVAVTNLIVAAQALFEAERNTRKQRDLIAAEQRIQRAARAHFRSQHAELLSRMNAEMPAQFRESSPLDLFVSIWHAVTAVTGSGLATVIGNVAANAARDGWRSAADDVGLDAAWNVQDPQAIEFLQHRGADRVAGIDATTQAELRNILANGMQQGDAYKTIAKAISDHFAQYERARAELIAITETGEAYEFGRTMVADRLQSQGIPMEKRWLTAGDPCPICAPNPEVGWIANGDTFPSGDVAPLAHPRCRCDLEVRAA